MCLILISIIFTSSTPFDSRIKRMRSILNRTFCRLYSLYKDWASLGTLHASNHAAEHFWRLSKHLGKTIAGYKLKLSCKPSKHLSVSTSDMCLCFSWWHSYDSILFFTFYSDSLLCCAEICLCCCLGSPSTSRFTVAVQEQQLELWSVGVHACGHLSLLPV